jgi:hypothetical protein
VVDNTSAVNTKIGVLFDNSIIRYNGGTGVTVTSAGTNCPGPTCVFVQVHIDKSEALQLGTGFSATGAGASIDVNESAAMNISTLCATSGGGAFNSFGNNAVSVGAIGCTPNHPPLQ